MTKKTRSQRNLLIGDLLEIHTRKGLAYAQCINKVPFYGHLIRVLPGFHKKPMTNLDNIVELQEDYVTFVFCDKDVNRSRMHIVARKGVPERCKQLPLFKAGNADPKTGKIETWWLWDGQKEWRVNKLTRSQKELPMCLIMNYMSLIHRLESGWHPRDEAK